MLEIHEMLDAIAVGVYGVYSDGTIAFANAGAERLLGRDRAELVGRHHHDVLGHAGSNGSLHPATTCPICTSVTQGRRDQSSNSRFRRVDGSMATVTYEVTPWNSSADRDGSVVTFRDVTEQQILHLQLLRAQKLESIGQLAAGIAHEINTPIQYVGDNNRFLERAFQQLANLLDAAHTMAHDTGDNRPSNDSLARLRQAAETADWDFYRTEIPTAIAQSLDGIGRVAVIVRAMKEFSHTSPTKSAVNLHCIIENTITIARNEWKYVADVVTDFDSSLPQLYCHSGEIGQVILNLLVNAAHAIDAARQDRNEKGTITIRTAMTDGHAELRISDTGTGIPNSIRDKVFDPFFTTKPVGKGTGQGLALAYRIVVERHKGTIDFESETGKGTTFIVRLPADESLIGDSHEAQREEAHSVR